MSRWGNCVSLQHMAPGVVADTVRHVVGTGLVEDHMLQVER